MCNSFFLNFSILSLFVEFCRIANFIYRKILPWSEELPDEIRNYEEEYEEEYAELNLE